MTPSQTQALLQEVKDEVVAAKNYKDFDSMLDYNMLHTGVTHKLKKEVLNKYINEAIELYHTRLLAEAGKGLIRYIISPGFESINVDKDDLGGWVEYEKASALLAAKQGEVEGFAKWVLENVLQLDEEDEWYSEGYRYRIYLSVAKSVQVKTFQEVYKHYKPQ